MRETVIKVENLIFDYVRESDDKTKRSTVRAVDGVSFDVEKGEFVAVIGKNGSGKSTMAKCLNALFLPTAGKVYVGGMDTCDDSHIWEIRQTAGMVFQNPDNQLVSSIVEDDIAFGPENLGIEPGEIRRRVDDALSAVRMTEYSRKSPHLLSGGQKQRVAIAGAIAMMPDIIIFDEPTAMLDPKGRKEILEIIKGLHEKGITVILITHYMEEAVEADRLIVMDKGKIVRNDDPVAVFTDKGFIEEYEIDPPIPVALAERLRADGLDIPEGVASFDGLADRLVELAR